MLQVLIGLFVLGSFGFESVFAETLIAASGEGTPAHFSKVNIGTGADSQFLGNSGLEFSGIDVSPDGRLFAASSGQGDGGLYELSVTIENGNSVATPILVDFPELTCSDISFSPTGTLYCMVTNFNSDLERGGLYSIDVDSGVLTFIGNPGLGRTSGNGLAINSAGIIYFGNDDGLYILNPVTGSATEVAPWNLVDTVFSRCKSNAMDFDSSDTLQASFQCGFDPYLGTIDTLTAKVSIIGPLSSTNPVYSAFPFRLGDMKTDAITFAPFDFDFLVGPTHGTVDVVGIVNVVPNPPNGVLVSTLAPVNIGLCENSSLAIGIGDTFTAECGSV